MSDIIKDTNQEIDLIKLAKNIWAKRWFVIKYTIVGAVAGLIIGFSIPTEFTTIIKMAPEGGGKSASGMGGLAQLAGINLGSTGAEDGINLTIYPDIVSSTPFLIELSQIPVKGIEMESSCSLYDYMDNGLSAPWWNSVLGAPLNAIGWLTSIGKDEQYDNGKLDIYQLTKKQAQILANLNGRIGVSIDKESGVITATSTMQDPVIAAIAADSILSKLQMYMTKYKTNKAKLDLDNTAKLYDETQKKYYAAQQSYAAYMDATQNNVKESIRSTQDRLRNEQQMAFGVYSQMAQQLELAKIKLQEQTPIATVIEPAKVPIQRSNTSKLILLVMFTFLGGFFAVGIVAAKILLHK